MAVFRCRHAVLGSDSVSSAPSHASTDRLKDIRSFEVEDPKGKSRRSQDVIAGMQSSELGKERRHDFLSTLDKMSMSSQTIFDLMKARVSDRKASEECTNRSSSHCRTKSPSEHRESDDRNERRSLSRSRDSAGHLMPGEEVIGNSGCEYTSYGQDSVRHPSSSSVYQIAQLYQSEAGDVDQDERYRSARSQNIAAHATPDSDVDLRSRSGYWWTYSDDPSLSSTSHVDHLRQSEPAADTEAGDFSLSNVQWLDSWTNASQDFDYRNYRKDY